MAGHKQTVSMLTRATAEAALDRLTAVAAEAAPHDDVVRAQLLELHQVEDFFGRGFMTPDARGVAEEIIARAHEWIRSRGLQAAYDTTKPGS